MLELEERNITATFEDGIVTFSGDGEIAGYVKKYGGSITVRYGDKEFVINLESDEEDDDDKAEGDITLKDFDSYHIDDEDADDGIYAVYISFDSVKNKFEGITENSVLELVLEDVGEIIELEYNEDLNEFANGDIQFPDLEVIPSVDDIKNGIVRVKQS